MSKPKHSSEWMLERVHEYLDGEGSFKSIAQANGISKTNLRFWVRKFQEQGETAFLPSASNKSYSAEFKRSCVEEVLRRGRSAADVAAGRNISGISVLRKWIKLYNAGMELKDYYPKREVYMAEARRATTLAERKEIAEYCIANGRDYKGTAKLYSVSYTQVYSWVKKYLAGGEEALKDRRGKRKAEEDLDEMERLRRQNQLLQRQLEESRRLNVLLKKLNEVERRLDTERRGMKRNT